MRHPNNGKKEKKRKPIDRPDLRDESMKKNANERNASHNK